MKAVVKKTLIILLLVFLIFVLTGCNNYESFETVLLFSELYAVAHGNIHPDGTVDWAGLFWDIWQDKRQDTPYERAVRATLFFIPGGGEDAW